MTTLIAFVAGLAGAALGLSIYHSGKMEGRREQIASDENHRKLIESMHISSFEALQRKFEEEQAKNKQD